MPLFRLFSAFSIKHSTIFQEISVKNVHPVTDAGIRTHTLPQPLDSGLPPNMLNVFNKLFRFLRSFLSLIRTNHLCEKCPSSLCHRDLNSQPSDSESPP